MYLRGYLWYLFIMQVNANEDLYNSMSLGTGLLCKMLFTFWKIYSQARLTTSS